MNPTLLPTELPRQRGAKIKNSCRKSTHHNFISLQTYSCYLIQFLFVIRRNFLNFQMKKIVLLTVMFIFIASILFAQTSGHDSSYYQSYKGSIIARIYFSRKYDEFKMNPNSN